MLEELLSREDCANCKICCKFEPDELVDAPVFNEEQYKYIKENIDSNIEFDRKDNLYQIKLVNYEKKYKCPLLTEKGCKLPNKYRPFDCESWPFYVMKKDDKYLITKSNDCPVFNKIDDKILIQYIEKKFLPIAKEIVIKTPGLVTDYNRDLKILYTFEMNEGTH